MSNLVEISPYIKKLIKILLQATQTEKQKRKNPRSNSIINY